jgi:hypothetical protein
MQNILDNFSRNNFGLRQIFPEMMKKYALLLCVYFAAEFVLNIVSPALIGQMADSFGFSTMDTAIYGFMFYLPTALLNVLAVIVMRGDMKKIGIRHRVLLLLTLLHCSVGIVFFLATLLYYGFLESSEGTYNTPNPQVENIR